MGIIVEDLFSQCDKTEVEYSWHGGEPLLQPISFYSEIFVYQAQKAKETGKKVNAIHTNIKLINDAWIEFFCEYNISISTSIDGTPALHDANRVFANGEGSFFQVYKGIVLAQKQGVKVKTLCVISKNNVNMPEEICRQFDELNIYHVGFLPCYIIDGGTVVVPSLIPGEYGHFLCRVLVISSLE